MATTESTWTLPGLTLRDVTLDVPLDRAAPERGTIEVFARVIAAEGGEGRPFLLYLQGGPGSEAPRPGLDPASPPWLERALADFRVVMLDQRGTGRSTPVGPDLPLPAGFAAAVVTARTDGTAAPEPTSNPTGESTSEPTSGSIAVPADDGSRPATESPVTLGQVAPEAQAEYLAHMRADAIVEDAEALREALGARTWSVLGQSFGGFCTLRYVSAHADSLASVLLTGGLPAVGRPIDDAYALTWSTMLAKSAEHYRRFPGDRDRVRRLMDLAAQGEVRLADGGGVSPVRLRGIGILLGASGGSERLHQILELDHRSPAFRHDLAAALPFGGRNPMYAVVHESCWADGGTTCWAAERTMPAAFAEDPTLLSGEHVTHEALAEDPELAPWLPAAELLAAREWPALYDVEALRAADVSGAAAVYYDDAYVPRELSLETAALLPGVKPWVTSEYEHNGLRASGDRVLDRLLGLASGRIVR